MSAIRNERRPAAAERLAAARKEYLPNAKPCPRCGTRPEDLEWSEFCSPADTWENLCGRAGWKTRCTSCRRVVDVFVTILN